MRKKIYNVVHVYDGNVFSLVYKYFMIAVIALSLVPLIFKEELPLFPPLECACFVIYLLDYALRWLTADYKLGGTKWLAFLKYPVRFISIVDLLSVFALFCSCTGFLESVKMAQALSVFRIIRILRYSKSVRTILEILKRSRKPLIAVGGLAVGYIIISAIVIFNVEPESFMTFFDAIYWATVSLTTVGYGDIYPVTLIGRTVAMLSSFFGIAVVALPAGIVTAEFLAAIKKSDCESEKKK